MKKILITALSILMYTSVVGQTLLSKDTYVKTLGTARDTLMSQIKDESRLVSEYSFRKLVRNDFSVLTTGDKNKTTVGRYASLEINEDEQKVNITPFVYIPGNQLLKAPFRSIFSVDLSASINSKKLFNFDDRNTITAGVSYTLVLAGFNFNPLGSNEKNRKPDTIRYHQIYKNVYSSFVKKYDDIKTINDSLDILGFAGDTTELQKAYLEKVSEYEEKLTKKIWNTKYFLWFKFGLSPLSFDNFDVININDPATFNKPKANSIYNPSLQISINYNSATRKYGSIYLSAFIKAGIKNSLSEITTANEWRNISSLGDSSFVTKDKKDVFVLSSTDIKTKLLPDFGLQAIYLMKIKDFRFGINLLASWNGIISPTDNSNSYVNILHTGFIIPIKDKEGENTINIEPYWERKSFVNYNKESKNIGGIKFSIPFQNLF
jgi:hypothetical protein